MNFSEEEIEFFIDGMSEVQSQYARRGGNRDFSWEDRFDEIMFKLAYSKNKGQ